MYPAETGTQASEQPQYGTPAYAPMRSTTGERGQVTSAGSLGGTPVYSYSAD
jgi:hypothetical protein